MSLWDDLISGANSLIGDFIADTNDFLDGVSDVEGTKLASVWESIRTVKYLNASYFLKSLESVAQLGMDMRGLIDSKITSINNLFFTTINTLKSSFQAQISNIYSALFNKSTELKNMIISRIAGISTVISDLNILVADKITGVYKSIGSITDILFNPATLLGLIESSLEAVW